MKKLLFTFSFLIAFYSFSYATTPSLEGDELRAENLGKFHTRLNDFSHKINDVEEADASLKDLKLSEVASKHAFIDQLTALCAEGTALGYSLNISTLLEEKFEKVVTDLHFLTYKVQMAKREADVRVEAKKEVLAEQQSAPKIVVTPELARLEEEQEGESPSSAPTSVQTPQTLTFDELKKVNYFNEPRKADQLKPFLNRGNLDEFLAPQNVIFGDRLGVEDFIKDPRVQLIIEALGRGYTDSVESNFTTLQQLIDNDGIRKLGYGSVGALEKDFHGSRAESRVADVGQTVAREAGRVFRRVFH